MSVSVIRHIAENRPWAIAWPAAQCVSLIARDARSRVADPTRNKSYGTPQAE
jgi:hypothetical protein